MPRPSNSEVEYLEDTIGKGQRAAGALRTLIPFVAEMTEAFLNNLAISGNSLTDAEMRLLVGKILGIRELKGRLDNYVTKGHAASERRDGR